MVANKKHSLFSGYRKETITISCFDKSGHVLKLFLKTPDIFTKTCQVVFSFLFNSFLPKAELDMTILNCFRRPLPKLVQADAIMFIVLTFFLRIIFIQHSRWSSVIYEYNYTAL